MATHLRFGLAGVTFGIALGIGWIIESDDGQGRAAVALMAPPTALALPHLVPALAAPPQATTLDMPAAVIRKPMRPMPTPLAAPAASDDAPVGVYIDASAEPAGCAYRLARGAAAAVGSARGPACERDAVASFSGAGLPAAVQPGWAHRDPADMPALVMPVAERPSR